MKKKWTLETVENEILEVVKFLGIDRMPSRNEVESYSGDTTLSNAISRTGGFYAWAEKLGLEVKESETELGIDLENRICDFMKATGFKDCEKTSVKFPYDLLVYGCVKIDVKAARKTKVRTSDAYTFRLAKTKPTCDIYVAACLNDEKEIERIYVIPAHIMTGKKQLAIGAKHSIYDCYAERWDIVQEFADAFRTIGKAGGHYGSKV